MNSSFSFGMITSFRLVIPPKMKNSAKTKICRSGASTPSPASAEVDVDCAGASAMVRL
ncbi:MAG: hypothetical protein U5K74_07560 [Gemmatimonadaceae bacterium]|nr:hypothetical protein [Gemmatimonadaceae bacterium]